MTSSPNRNASLDALRVLSLFGIVTLHVAGGGFADNKPLGFVVDELSRFAVPVFFLMSAYFWKDADLAAPLRLTGKVARRVLPAFVAILAATLAYRLLAFGRLKLDLSPQGVLLLLWSGGPAFHLWFLPALVLGTAIVATLMRLVGTVGTVAVSTALYLIGTAIGAYSGVLLGHGFPFWMDRNGLFFAPIFLVSGIVLRRSRDEVQTLPLVPIVAAIVVFAGLHIAEGYFIVGRYPLGHDFSITTLGYALAVALLFMRIELKSPIWSTLGQATFGAYLIHLFVLEFLVNTVRLGNNSPVLIVTACIVSLALSATFRAGRTRLEGLVARA